MTTKDAQTNLQSLLDSCVFKGNIFGNTNEVMAMQASLNILAEKANTVQKQITELKTKDNVGNETI